MWKKLGNIFEFISLSDVLFSHAANPMSKHIRDDQFRIFFSCRDKENRSSVCFVDYDLATLKIIYEHSSPVIQYGKKDSFYSHGISIGNHYTMNGKLFVLFMGWQCPEDSHWRGDIGRFQLIENQAGELSPTFPFIGSDEEDPISLSYPWVIYEEGIYKMWYGSTVSWDAGNGEMLHVIKYATSNDGERWTKHGQVLPHILGTAQAFSRPTVYKENEIYHMYFSYRGVPPMKYRIGYATSLDGIKWTLKNEEAGITVSESGWDSEMVCYPYVFDHKGERYMLYNGNGYGKTGFGLAVLEK
ncbi:MAG: hypothetical protein IPL26_22205 [Leptospiraceae bacterium]|nr:hypothetical protein [Leptospiraceae bacterium]